MNPIGKRILELVFGITRHHAWLVLLLVLVLTGVAGYYVRELPIRTSYLDLLPENDPLINEYREHETYLAQSDYVTLLLTALEPDEFVLAREDLLRDAAATIARQLRMNPEFTQVTYLIEPSPKIPDQYLLLYTLDSDKLSRIEASVSLARQTIATEELSLLPSTDPSYLYEDINRSLEQTLYGTDSETAYAINISAVEEQLQEMIELNQAILESLDGIKTFPAIIDAVEGLAEIFAVPTTRVERAPQAFVSSDGKMLLMTVQPRFPSQQGTHYCTQVMRILSEELERINLEQLGVKVGITGTYAFVASANAVVNRDMQLTTVISSVGVFVVLFLAFGSLFYTIITVIPLVIGLILTMAWAKFAMGGFNLITTFLPALILGLGIDYGIHFVSRYAEERRKGEPFDSALHTAILRKGNASFWAAATTALVFLCLLFSRSRAMFEMGAITSMGVVIAFLCTLFVLPSLLALSHHIPRFQYRALAVDYSRFLGPLFRALAGKWRIVFVATIALALFMAFQAVHTSFQFVSSDIIPDTESHRVQEEIIQNFVADDTKIGNYFTFLASSENELSRLLDNLSHSDLVRGVDSAKNLLPPNLSEQQDILSNLDLSTYLNQLDFLDRNLENRAASLIQLRTLLAKFGFIQYAATLNGMEDITLASSEIQSQLRQIQDELARLDIEKTQNEIYVLNEVLYRLDANLGQLRELPPVETLLRDILAELPEGIRARYLTPSGEFIIYARMSEALHEGDNLEEFDALASSLSSRYFGMPKLGIALEKYMKSDFWRSTLLAILLIAIILWRSTGGIIRAFLASTPLILGYICMLGGMRLLGIKFNFVNIAVSPLLIGIGIDNGIHILHRYLEERSIQPRGAIVRAETHTALAVIVTSLTTMLVFGSLFLARTPGLRFLGISALLGIGSSLGFSLLFLPAALHADRANRL